MNIYFATGGVDTEDQKTHIDLRFPDGKNIEVVSLVSIRNAVGALDGFYFERKGKSLWWCHIRRKDKGRWIIDIDVF